MGTDTAPARRLAPPVHHRRSKGAGEHAAMGSLSEEEILAGMRDPARRPQAFRELHVRFGPRLLGLLVKMCRGDRETAEDLLGRALYKAYVALARMEEPCRSLSA